MVKKNSSVGRLVNASDELKVRKNGIGWTSDRFTEMCKKQKLTKVGMPTFQKTVKDMTDSEIEGELKPGYCTLSDVYAFIKKAPAECRDGYANLFYFEQCVVRVRWSAGSGGWRVFAWDRDVHGWAAGDRIFSPATGRNSDTQTVSTLALESSDTLPEILTINGIEYKRV